MSRTFPTTVVEALNAQTTDALVLTLLKITHPSWDDVFLVNNTVDVPSNGQTYQAFPFSLVLPADSDELQPILRVAVNNVTRELVDEVRTIAGSTARALCTVSLIEFDDPDTVLVSWSDFILANLNYDANNMTFDLYIENFLTEPFPSRSFTPSNFPGLF